VTTTTSQNPLFSLFLGLVACLTDLVLVVRVEFYDAVSSRCGSRITTLHAAITVHSSRSERWIDRRSRLPGARFVRLITPLPRVGRPM